MIKDAEQLLRVRKREEEVREQGCRAVVKSKKREEELMEQGCRAVA